MAPQLINQEGKYEITQSYIRFDFSADSDFKIALENYLLYKGNFYSSEIFHKELLKDGLFFSVELQEGSLKSKLKIFGQIALGALTYGSIRETMDYLIKDSQTITELIVRDLSLERNLNPNTIGRVERRLGVPGKIKRLFLDLDYLKKNRDNLTEKEQQQLITQISKQYESLVFELDKPEINLIKDIIIKNENIPLQFPSKNLLEYPTKYMIREEEIRLISEKEIKEIKLLPPPQKYDNPDIN